MGAIRPHLPNKSRASRGWSLGAQRHLRISAPVRPGRTCPRATGREPRSTTASTDGDIRIWLRGYAVMSLRPRAHSQGRSNAISVPLIRDRDATRGFWAVNSSMRNVRDGVESELTGLARLAGNAPILRAGDVPPRCDTIPAILTTFGDVSK